MKNRILGLLLAFSILVTFCAVSFGCANDEKETSADDIIILFTNDVHCGIEDDIGYAGLVAYKKLMQTRSRFVTLVDCGDFSSGDYYCAASKGESSIEILNAVGYDYITLGNHEFDFGTEQLAGNLGKLNAKAICCNLKYIGKGENPLKDVKPYEIAEYGDVRVGFVGVTTPSSIFSPAHFLEKGEVAYSLCEGDNGNNLYKTVQDTIDACRGDGADVVVLLSHLGIDKSNDAPYTALDLIANITGADVVLDAHSHVEIPCDVIKDKDGKDVLLSSTGTKLDNIGRLVITGNGLITVGYIGDYPDKDEETVTKITQIVARYDAEEMNREVATLPFTLSCSDENGVRMVRNRETAIGNLVADAYRWLGNSDIGMVNGGGVRADLPAGGITNKDIISVNPYGNMLCVAKVQGSELLDMLEYFYRSLTAERVKDGKAVGEEGSFQHLSGLHVVIDTSVPSSIAVDETDMLVSVGETRRVKSVTVLKNGEYVPLDPNEFYTITSTDYMIKNGGSGMARYLADNEITVNELAADYQAVLDYITYLDGDFSAYEKTEGRIIIE